MIVIVPTDPPNLESVEYGKTATYHWPQFQTNVTDEFGATPTEGFKEVNGPSMFKKGMELSHGQVGLKKHRQMVD